ncbi:hypothetical protein FMEAI12_4280018 [Parafrankia sp. Ea1.12]|nr:hypothetical protein FMEAI12_4280018 [Parafrankia sp. Ea1.12]
MAAWRPARTCPSAATRPAASAGTKDMRASTSTSRPSPQLGRRADALIAWQTYISGKGTTTWPSRDAPHLDLGLSSTQRTTAFSGGSR